MKIYNTLTRKKEDFIPLTPGQVKIYVCGPTVYDYIHIGNARPQIVFDTLRRYMEYRGFDVIFVSNFTDVDDRIIKKANQENTTETIISERYIIECEKDMKAMNVRPATIHPKATEEIPEMVEMIKTLIDKNHAYAAADGTVYYRTRSFADYGKLSKKNLDDLKAGNRTLLVTGEEQKEDPLDFVLWKPQKENEPAWESPWCDGRPGWHIECSAMSKKYLGDEIDIHTGGVDLIFPHHENEIAQSEAANGKPFARYWMHNAFLNINNEKMSKSEGNFVTVRDVSEKYDLQILRFFILSAHYRSPLNFGAEMMEAAKNGLERIINCVSNLDYQLRKQGKKQGDGSPAFCTSKAGEPSPCFFPCFTEDEKNHLTQAETYKTKFESAMDDDLNTADAISYIFELVKYTNSIVNENNSPGFIEALKQQILLLTDICGLIVEKKEEILDEEIEALINERQTARKEKNFARADEIRNELLSKGIILEDTREGVKIQREILSHTEHD